jgi:hypothetical protein
LDGGKSIVPQIKPSLRPELKHIEIIQDSVSGAWISIIKKIQKYNIMTTITTQNRTNKCYRLSEVKRL